MSAIAKQLAQQFAGVRLKPRTEYRFAAEHLGPGKGLRARLAGTGMRDWRFDFAWPAERLAVEVEGGVGYAPVQSKSGKQIVGHHVHAQGYEDDCHKYAIALLLGWRVLRVTPKQIRDGRALQWVLVALEVEELRGPAGRVAGVMTKGE